jgi:hypothetical protein
MQYKNTKANIQWNKPNMLFFDIKTKNQYKEIVLYNHIQ